ncbi:hypothetical protein ACFUEM_08870 [Streptomyces anulatus]|uniref:hypothetical protein n=1 Tax=Streptomyces anulatus TaxID=1892 RepID=UPI0035DD0453
MREEVDSRTGTSRFVVFAGLAGWSADEVYVIGNVSGGEPVPLTPAQARGMADALRRAADEAEGVRITTYRDITPGTVMMLAGGQSRRTVQAVEDLPNGIRIITWTGPSGTLRTERVNADDKVVIEVPGEPQ